MLSPTSPTQKKFSEEDSSGSDAGSEVSLEPETDRFGFILTNGSTAGSVGPSPELVRQRETKWINIISQWDRMLLKNSSKVKTQCQKGIPASLRAKCWPLLCGATDRMKQNENTYQCLDSQPALQSWVDVIERDLDRQFPFHEMFLSKDGHGQRGLFRVLKAYTQYQPEEGYCQAQGPVAAVLLMNMPAEEAFWCLVQISEQYLPGYYSPLLEGVLFDAAVLTWVLKRTSPAAHKHLQHHGVEPLMFATDWLMCLFTRHLPFNTLLRVWDLFFCYGVRVLLQVAVVLVRRVLGRAEQRKQCQGQMETLERLRGVREQVQDEDDAFIAEVCSVPLSARDLEKQTEKELGKWRKDRPSSTFDPRGRCQGYRMAWARARQGEEERDRREREKGNLSVPLTRSASTLSLSPSLLHKRWRKGGKVNTASEWEGSSSRVVRHLSMGAKEDWRAELNFKKVQGVQEEEGAVFDEHKKQSEAKLTGQTEQKELLEEPKKMEIHSMPTEQVEQTVTTEEMTEHVETRIMREEERQVKETRESKVLLEQTEERNMETEQINDQTVKHKQGEEMDKSKDKDTNKKTEKHTAAVEESHTEIQNDEDVDQNTEVETQESVNPSEETMVQADIKPEESAGTEIVQQTEVETVKTKTSPHSQTDSKIEAPTVKDPTTETETQQQQQEVITETDRISQGDASDGKYHSSDSLAETDMKEESYTQTETDERAQTQEQVEEDAAKQECEAEIVQVHSEHADSQTGAGTSTQGSPECIPTKEGTDVAADTETDVETPVAIDTVVESSEALEKECDAVASEATQEEKDRNLTAHSDTDQTQAEKTPTETETTDSLASASIQAEAETLTTAKPDGKASSIETFEGPAPEEPTNQVTVEEKESTGTVEVNTVGENDSFISCEPTNSPNTDSKQQVQHKDSDLVKPDNSGLIQTARQRSSRSSGDFCLRKPSNSRGSRLARRLSEDLFTMPEKTSQSQSTCNLQDVKHSEAQSSSLPAEVTERTAVQQEKPPPDPPKRFGLFRRLRGEQQPKEPKGTPKIQVPKILIQDFSDGTGMGKLVEEKVEEKLSSRERRRRRRDIERREKEEERLRNKREKELGKEKERERRKLQMRGRSFQVQGEKGSNDVTQPAKTGSQMLRYSASYAESYF